MIGGNARDEDTGMSEDEALERAVEVEWLADHFAPTWEPKPYPGMNPVPEEKPLFDVLTDRLHPSWEPALHKEPGQTYVPPARPTPDRIVEVGPILRTSAEQTRRIREEMARLAREEVEPIEEPGEYDEADEEPDPDEIIPGEEET